MQYRTFCTGTALGTRARSVYLYTSTFGDMVEIPSRPDLAKSTVCTHYDVRVARSSNLSRIRYGLRYYSRTGTGTAANGTIDLSLSCEFSVRLALQMYSCIGIRARVRQYGTATFDTWGDSDGLVTILSRS